MISYVAVQAMDRRQLQRIAKEFNIKATQSNLKLKELISINIQNNIKIDDLVAKCAGQPTGVVRGIGNGTLFVSWAGHSIQEVSNGLDGVYDVRLVNPLNDGIYVSMEPNQRPPHP